MQANPRSLKISPHPSIANIAGVGLIFFVCAFGGVYLTRIAGNVAVLWFATGFLLAVMLSSPRRHWPAYISVCFVANTAADMLNGVGFVMSLGFAVCAGIEAIMVAVFLRPKRTGGRINLFVPETLLKAGMASVLATTVAASLGSAMLLADVGVPFGATFPYWWMADLLGLALVTPLVLIIRSRELQNLFQPPSIRKTLVVLGMAIGTAIAVFSHRDMPLLFVVFPPMILVAFRLGSAGNALAVCLVSAIAILFTLDHTGPMQLMPGPPSNIILYLQFFLVLIMLTTFPVATVVEARRRLLQALRLNEKRYRLLADNAGDAILHLGLDGSHHYISPGLTDILGWRAEDLTDGYITDHVHPDHVWHVQNVLASLTAGTEREVLSYMCQSKDGSFVWIETGFSLIRDPATAEPAEIVAIIRDVSARKQIEERLAEANRHLQMLASTDSLSGIANRRRFDVFLTEEWRRSMRSNSPMALLMIDIDWFKAFNDFYGHRLGDDCLRSVASAVAQMARRPGDLAARYGGEEFALILGETDAVSAKAIAELLAERIHTLRIAHGGSNDGVVTVSIGISSMIPSFNLPDSALVEAADMALYEAKGAGRNCTRIHAQAYTRPSAPDSRTPLSA